jgi:hypothetical protein
VPASEARGRRDGCRGFFALQSRPRPKRNRLLPVVVPAKGGCVSGPCSRLLRRHGRDATLAHGAAGLPAGLLHATRFPIPPTGCVLQFRFPIYVNDDSEDRLRGIGVLAELAHACGSAAARAAPARTTRPAKRAHTLAYPMTSRAWVVFAQRCSRRRTKPWRWRRCRSATSCILAQTMAEVIRQKRQTRFDTYQQMRIGVPSVSSGSDESLKYSAWPASRKLRTRLEHGAIQCAA